MMKDETILLLTYYYNQEDREHPLLRHILTRDYCPAYLPWDLYLQEPLQAIFKKVIVYDYLKRRAEIGLQAMNDEIVDLTRKECPKYVLWTSFYHDVFESTLESLRKNGSLVTGIFFDDEIRFDNYSKYWAPHLDYCITNSIEAVDKYQALHTKAIHIVPNTGIPVARDLPEVKAEYDISFVGSINFVDRKKYVDRIKRENLPVHVFGEGSGGYISFEKMTDIFQKSKINLNFSKVGTYQRARQLKGRIFQVCMSGGFVLTEYAPGVEQYFEPDQEIVCFDNEDEMIEKTNYYLGHETERLAITQAGWQRAVNEYSSSRMMSRVFHKIEQDLSAGKKNGCSNERVPELKMPALTRTLIPSQYHFQWGKALLEENYAKSLWKDSLKLSLSYSWFNISTWYYYLVGFLPSPMRPLFFQIYNLSASLFKLLLSKLRSIPCLNDIFRYLITKLLYNESRT